MREFIPELLRRVIETVGFCLICHALIGSDGVSGELRAVGRDDEDQFAVLKIQTVLVIAVVDKGEYELTVVEEIFPSVVPAAGACRDLTADIAAAGRVVPGADLRDRRRDIHRLGARRLGLDRDGRRRAP